MTCIIELARIQQVLDGQDTTVWEMLEAKFSGKDGSCIGRALYL